MDNDSPEVSSKELAQEEDKKWNKIIASEVGEDQNNDNLIAVFAMFERTVKNLTGEFQRGENQENPDTLDGLWKMYLSMRKNVVEAYEYKDSKDIFKQKITGSAMQLIDGLFHATNYLDKKQSLWNRLAPEMDLASISLKEEYGIKTHIPSELNKPDLTKEHIVKGSGDKISRVLQPGFYEKDTGKVIREAVVETE